jgi:hypothetical protein
VDSLRSDGRDDNETASYDAEGVAQLETIWGEGFMSPGGPAEVGRIVAGVPIAGCDVLDIGCGTVGAPLASAQRRGERVLRPGGRLCIGHWFRGEGAELDGEVDAFIASSGEEFFMQSLHEDGELVASLGRASRTRQLHPPEDLEGVKT